MERTTITIDFRNCKSTNEIQNLFKENLNIPEWNEKKPDDLIKSLKDIEPYEIYIVGANLVPNGISKYMKQAIDILNKVEELYNRIFVIVMDVITIDFTGIKQPYQIHDILRKKLDFPEWYGENLPALWDLLVRYIEPFEIHLKGTNDIPENLQPFMQKVVEIFQRAESRYNCHKIIME